jgi:hypothetical protein
MTSEVAVIRRKTHGRRAAVQNGPAAPELAADAYECIMVRSSEDRPNIRLWRPISAHNASSPRISSSCGRVASNLTVDHHHHGEMIVARLALSPSSPRAASGATLRALGL